MDAKTRLAKITERNIKPSRPHKKGDTWPLEKKVEVVTQFLVLGNMKQVSVLTGVSYDLIRQWKTQEWWQEIEKEIRQTQNIELEVKLANIVEKSLAATLDRVENGDFIYDQKQGKLVRKPAALRDIHKVATDLIDRREMLKKGEAERGESNKVSIDEHLKMLKHQMSQWFEPKKQNVEIIENEVSDAIYEERQAGLQTGASVGTQEETGEGPATSGAERSSEDGDGSGTGPER